MGSKMETEIHFGYFVRICNFYPPILTGVTWSSKYYIKTCKYCEDIYGTNFLTWTEYDTW